MIGNIYKRYLAIKSRPPDETTAAGLKSGTGKHIVIIVEAQMSDQVFAH